MYGRKLVLIMAITLPITGVLLVAQPASASGGPVGSGTLTCAVGGEVNFVPALTPDGTPPGGSNGNHEYAYVQLELSNCTGPDSNTPQPNPTAAVVNGQGKVRLKDTKGEFMGHIVKTLGGCAFSDFDPDGTLKNTEKWTGGAPVFKTQAKIALSTVGGHANDTTTNSYAGTGSGTLYQTAQSQEQYDSVCSDPDGSGSVSSVEFDPSSSTLTFGGSSS